MHTFSLPPSSPYIPDLYILPPTIPPTIPTLTPSFKLVVGCSSSFGERCVLFPE